MLFCVENIQEYSSIKMIQIAHPENLNTAEERHEMILAHEKFGMKIRNTIRISNVSYFHSKLFVCQYHLVPLLSGIQIFRM